MATDDARPSTDKLAFRCPEHGIVASGKFALRLARSGDPVCLEHVPERLEGADGAGRPRCGKPLTRHGVDADEPFSERPWSD